MAINPFVRIVKRGQQAAASAPAESAAPSPRTQPEVSALTIKATVSTWVREFQQRSQADAKLAFHNLFTEPLPPPSAS